MTLFQAGQDQCLADPDREACILYPSQVKAVWSKIILSLSLVAAGCMAMHAASYNNIFRCTCLSQDLPAIFDNV